MVLKDCVRFCCLTILLACKTAAQGLPDKAGSVSLLSVSLFSSIFFKRSTVEQLPPQYDERLQGEELSVSLPVLPDSESLDTLRTKLIPDELPDWRLQSLYQQWHWHTMSIRFPETNFYSPSKHRIYLTLIDQQFRVALVPSDGFSTSTQRLLAERCLNTLLQYLLILLDIYDIPVNPDGILSSAAAGGDDGDDDPHYPSHNNQFDVFVFQPETGWNPLFQLQSRQRLLEASIRQKRRLLAYLQRKIRIAIHNGHEQLARILRDRVMVTEASLNELLNQILHPEAGLYNDENASVIPLLQNLLNDEISFNEEHQSTIMMPSYPQDGGGGADEKDKKATSQEKQPEKGKRRREKSDSRDQPPPGKRSKQQESGDGAGSPQKEPPCDLSLAQRCADINQWLLLDIAWEFKDDQALLSELGFPREINKRKASNYLIAFACLHNYISDNQIESVQQLSELFSSGSTEILERFNKVIREYRKEHDDIVGEYLELHSFLMDKKQRPKTHNIQGSFLLGLHLGIPFEVLKKGGQAKSSVFIWYKSKYPRMPLANFFPLLRKGLSRIGQKDLYQAIYSAYNNRFSESDDPKPKAASKKEFFRNFEAAEPVDIEGFSKTSKPAGNISYQLPYEVWLRVFSFVDIESLGRSRLVCRFFYRILDDPQLHVTAWRFNGYIKYHHGNILTREEVMKSPWFHLAKSWIEVLEESDRKDGKKTNTEMIRHCILDSRILQGYLWKEIGLVKLISIQAAQIGDSVFQIQTGCSRHQACPSENFALAVATVNQLSYFRYEKGRIKKYFKAKKTNNQEKVALLNVDHLYAALNSCFTKLRILDAGNKKNSLVEERNGITCMGTMRRDEATVLITFSYRLKYIAVDAVQKIKDFYKLVPIQYFSCPQKPDFFLTLSDQTKLVMYHGTGHVSLYEFDQKGTLRKLHPFQKLPGLGSIEVHFPARQFIGKCFCGIASVPYRDRVRGQEYEGHLFSWNSNFEQQFTFSSPKLLYCGTLGFLDDNTLITTNRLCATLWRNQACGWEELESIQVFSGTPEKILIRQHYCEKTVRITSLSVIDECRILLGDSIGRVAVYYIPYSFAL